jgi:hypoxanthine-guanine phosphoribosyltransferase
MIIYLYLPKGLNFSLTSNISLRRKLKTQAESDFIHILRYSDKILVDDPGEKKCSVGDVRCFFILVFNFYIFFRAETPTKRAKTPTKQAKTPEMRFSCKTVNFFNTVINNISTIYSLSGHLNQTSSKSLKTQSGRKKHPRRKKTIRAKISA